MTSTAKNVVLHRWALVSGSGKTEKTCLAYHREGAAQWFRDWRHGRGIIDNRIPATWKVLNMGPATAVVQESQAALTSARAAVRVLQQERDEAQTALQAEQQAHEATKARLAFGAQEVDRMRADVEHHKSVAAANAHRERWEQRRAGRAEEKLRDLEALVRAERIKQRSGTTSLVGAADFILGVSDPSTKAVSTSSPISTPEPS